MSAQLQHALWTMDATARRLGCGRGSVDRLVDQGYLVKVRLPGFARRVAITAESIDRYEALVLDQANRLQVLDRAVV